LDSDNAVFDAHLYFRVTYCQPPFKGLYNAIKLTVCLVRLCASRSSFPYTSRCIGYREGQLQDGRRCGN
jgi:hypothetical protein